MDFITKKLDFSNQTIKEMELNSKNFYNLIKKRRSVRDFKKKIRTLKTLRKPLNLILNYSKAIQY